MNTPLSDNILKKKKKKRSPLSETYSKFLKKEDIKLPSTKKSNQVDFDEIKINVIKSPEIYKEKPEKPEKSEKSEKSEKPEKPEKKCKRKRVRLKKDGTPNSSDIKHNKECEKIEGSPKKNKIQKKSKMKGISKNKETPKKRKKSKRLRKVTKKKKLSSKNNLKKEMQKAKTMSNNQIKQELRKDGIEIKGDHTKLLRDIYVFSNLGGIKIHKE